MNRKTLLLALIIISLAALTVTTALAGWAPSQPVTTEDSSHGAVAQSHSPSNLSLADRIRFHDQVLDLARIRSATAQYKRLEVATSAGYAQLPGLDHCFNNPGVGAMGYHHIQAASLDLNLDLEGPEAMVYAPGPNGQLQLAAVEYIVPAALWDNAGNSNLPKLLGTSLHLNEELGVYVLHAWVWKNNPEGMYEDWNPKVTCP